MVTAQPSPSPTTTAPVGLRQPLCHSAATGDRFSPAGRPPQLGIVGYHVAGAGEYVLGVERGSEAARAGLKRGDLILAINGRRLSDTGAWHRAIGGAAAGDGAVSVLVHDGQTGRVRCRRCTVFSPPWMR